jgi:uncharacterized protein (TIGR02996 family)
VNEADFILAILTRPDDESVRLVYADWLEERGDSRAEFLRQESELTRVRREVERLHRELTLQDLSDDNEWTASDRVFALREAEIARQHRLSELQPPISAQWLNWVDRSRIEGCGIRFDFQCPVQWDQLTLTDDVRVRQCPQCDRAVHFCDSIQEAQEKGAQGHCLAVASSISRTDGDVHTAADSMDIGLIDMESVRKNMPPPRQRLTERRLPLPLVQRIQTEMAFAAPVK